MAVGCTSWVKRERVPEDLQRRVRAMVVRHGLTGAATRLKSTIGTVAEIQSGGFLRGDVLERLAARAEECEP